LPKLRRSRPDSADPMVIRLNRNFPIGHKPGVAPTRLRLSEFSETLKRV
jgi:hypothetical protein